MLNWIVTSSVLILVVIGLRFALRGKISPRLQYALWLVVLVIVALTGLYTVTGTNKDFHKWMRSVGADSMNSVKVYTGTGAAEQSYYLTENEKTELAAIMNTVEESDYEERGDDGGYGSYCAELTVNRIGGEMKVLFYCLDSGEICVINDGQEEESFNSPELYTFIQRLVDTRAEYTFEQDGKLTSDIDRDGKPETIAVTQNQDEPYYTIEIRDEDEPGMAVYYMDDSRWQSLMVCTVWGQDCVLYFGSGEEDGLNSFVYELYCCEEEKTKLLAENRVTFDELYTAENAAAVRSFFEELKTYLPLGVLVYNTHNGAVTLGPVSPEIFINQCEDRLNSLSLPSDFRENVLDAMKRADAAEPEDADLGGKVTAEQFTEALHQAVNHEISVEEAIAEGYGKYGTYTWDFSIYVEAVHSEDKLPLTVECWIPENLVKVTYGTYDGMDVAYFRDAQLYELIRYQGYGAENDYKRIETEHYERFEPFLTAEMEDVLDYFKTKPGGAYGYEPVRFYYESSYEEADGSIVEQYLFSFGILAEDPVEALSWWGAGSAMVDSQLRLTGGMCGGVFAVRWRDGELAAQTVVKGNFSYDPDALEPYPGYGNYQRKILKTELDEAEFGGEVE